ncbi:MAG: hypothetical protein WC824_14685 [Bacteroidota bacterium]
MRRVILDRAYGGPDGVDIETGRCKCPPAEGECIHQMAVRWNVEMHTPANYEACIEICRELKDHGREDLAVILGKACIGLNEYEMRQLWDVLKKGFRWS